jgi:hypothetical protein
MALQALILPRRARWIIVSPTPDPTMLSDGTTNIVYGIGNEQIQTVTVGVATWCTRDHFWCIVGSARPDPRSLIPDP